MSRPRAAQPTGEPITCPSAHRHNSLLLYTAQRFRRPPRPRAASGSACCAASPLLAAAKVHAHSRKATPLSGAVGMLPLRGRPLVSGAGGTRAALSFLPTPSLAVTASVDMRGQLSAAIVLALAVAWAVYLVPRGGQQDAEDAALPLLPSPLDAATVAEAPRRMATALTFVSALSMCGRGLVGQLVCNVMVAE